MKFNFIQGDFSSGELSPRAQGHVDSDAYKAGLRLAANVAPTRTGSIASRAGLEARHECIDGHTGLPANTPVQHIPIHDGPFGDFVLEISPTGIRMMDAFGVQPWNFEPSSSLLQFTEQDGSFSYADPATRTVYLRSDAGTGARSYFLSKGSGVQNALIDVLNRVGIPAGTNETWTLTGRIAGDAVTVHVVQSNPANFQDFVITQSAAGTSQDGTFSITFRPNIGGADQNFYIQLISAAGTTATKLWDLNLFKNGIKTIQDTTTATRLGTTPLAPASFNGTVIAAGPERVRAAAFWAHGVFWIAFAGGPNNAYAGFAMAWFGLNQFGVENTPAWTFGTLPCTPNSMAQIVGANAVAVFQDRLWYGVNLANGKRAIRASVVGFGKEWGVLAAADSTGSTQSGFNLAGNWLFQFVVETETQVSAAGNFTPGVGTTPGIWQFPYHFPVDSLPGASGSVLSVRVSGQPRLYTKDFTVAGDGNKFEVADASAFADQTQAPGGKITFQDGTSGIAAGLTIDITRNALATDPLDLNLASPTAKIAWLNVLRGLILGTTRNEKLFSQTTSLSLDPASGQSFDVVDESNLGSDTAVPAVDLNDHVLFVQRGRRILRLAGINIATSGGLVADDIGVAGEHLTKARIRSMCYLKSPVPRVVFAFDDGTGAVMTLVGKGIAFSRLTTPACFGGIYSVASVDSTDDSELWVGTENGVTLRAATFESDIVTKEVQVLAAYPAGPTHLKYDTETPLPPVMDGWKRLAVVKNLAGVCYVAGLPACAVGQNAYVLANGNVAGPYPVTAGGAVDVTALGLDTTWVDAAGVRRAQDVYVGLAFPDHRFTTLPLEGGNPVGASQNLTSRKPQLYVRLVDSYLPLVNGKRLQERGATDATDLLPARVTEDLRATEEGYQRGGVVDVVMDLPLRMEISALHGGVVMNNI